MLEYKFIIFKFVRRSSIGWMGCVTPSPPEFKSHQTHAFQATLCKAVTCTNWVCTGYHPRNEGTYSRVILDDVPRKKNYIKKKGNS